MQLEIVPLELLRKVADMAPKPAKVSRNGDGHYQRFDLDGFLAQHGITVKRDMPWNGGERRLVLEVCPWNADHTNGSAYIVQFQDGAIAAGCHHNGCADKGWPELRELFEPDYKNRKEANVIGQQIIDSIVNGNGHPNRDTRQETDEEAEKLQEVALLSRVSCHSTLDT